jgi:hypothetical protein
MLKRFFKPKKPDALQCNAETVRNGEWWGVALKFTAETDAFFMTPEAAEDLAHRLIVRADAARRGNEQ